VPIWRSWSCRLYSTSVKKFILITGASPGAGAAVRAGAFRPWRGCRAGGTADRQLKILEDRNPGEGAAARAAVQDGRHGYRIDRQGPSTAPKQRSVRSACSSTMPASPSKSSRSIRPRRTGSPVINANLKGAYVLATEMARRMIARRQEGNIVNIALRARLRRDEVPVALTRISKAGIIQATKVMALELAGNRIRVNALAPGYIDTEMNHDFWSTPAGEKLAKRIPQRARWRRIRSRRRHHAVGLQCLALHDRQPS